MDCVLFIFTFQMEDVSVHKLEKKIKNKKSFPLPDDRMLGDNAVLAFSAFAGV